MEYGLADFYTRKGMGFEYARGLVKAMEHPITPSKVENIVELVIENATEKIDQKGRFLVREVVNSFITDRQMEFAKNG